MRLAERQCEPCEVGGAPLTAAEAQKLARETPEWSVLEKAIERQFQFKDFREAVAFVNRVADAAEEQGHHPDISIYYSKVRLTLSTHKTGGLTENDFILAAKIDRLV
jgi:4a-hydroxytetrahydrobiopterin dehydratase